MNLHDHWNTIYQTKPAEAMSWHQARPQLSLDLTFASGVRKDAGILDVGGGDSALVDCLLNCGYGDVGVLDVSSAALERARRRLGLRAAEVEWFEADVTRFDSHRRFGLWHDRAVFHFLTLAEERAKYVETLRRILHPRGHVIIATFALDGPAKCSGLDVMRHDGHSIGVELGPDFALRETRHETHVTPWRSEQQFIYCRFEHSIF